VPLILFIVPPPAKNRSLVFQLALRRRFVASLFVLDIQADEIDDNIARDSFNGAFGADHSFLAVAQYDDVCSQ
jgi:hypothetical protein